MNTYYTFNFITAFKLRREAKINDKLVSQKTEQLQTSCLKSLDFLNTNTLDKIQTEQNNMKTQVNRLDNFLEEGDKFGRKLPVKFPILSAAEISIHKKAISMNMLWMVLMVLAEVGLYYVVSPYFIPKIGGEIFTASLRIVASFVFAIAIMYAISNGYNKIFEYIEAKHLFKKKEIEENILEDFKTKQKIGIALLIFGFGAIIVMAVMRHLMLRSSIDITQITDSILRNSASRKADSASLAAIFACSLAIIFGVLLAVSKNDAMKYSIRYRVLQMHLRSLTQLNKCMTRINTICRLYKNRFAKVVKCSCDLVLHLKRLAKREVDAEFKDLANDFAAAKREPDFIIDENKYRKYQDIISKDKDLLLFPVTSSGNDINQSNLQIKEKRDEAEAIHKACVDQHSLKGNELRPAQKRPGMNAAMVLLLGCLLFFSSCSQNKARIFLVFLDASGSISENTKVAYGNYLREIILASKPGDKIISMPIDAGTLNSSMELSTIIVPDNSAFIDETDPPQEADILQKTRFESYMKKEVSKFDSCFASYINRSKYRSGTDIIGAFEVAMLYNVDTSKYIPVLIIMSDGLNCTPELNLEKGYRASYNEVLNNHKRVNLSDWNIFFLTGENDKVTSKRYVYAQTFWMDFLKAKKAKDENIFYASGARTVLVEKLKRLGEHNE